MIPKNYKHNNFNMFKITSHSYNIITPDSQPPFLSFNLCSFVIKSTLYN